MRPTHRDVLLLVEVAESSLPQDLGEKARLYAEHDVPEYWVVDIVGQKVHVHREPRNGHFRSIDVFNCPSSISPLCQVQAKLELVELFDFDS